MTYKKTEQQCMFVLYKNVHDQFCSWFDIWHDKTAKIQQNVWANSFFGTRYYILDSILYSQTCIRQPALGLTRSGCLIQVTVLSRFYN